MDKLQGSLNDRDQVGPRILHKSIREQVVGDDHPSKRRLLFRVVAER